MAIAAAPAAAFAGTTSGNVAVTATVSNNCAFGSAGTSTMPFGSYDPVVANASSTLQVQGSLSLTCTKSDSVSITLDAGQNGANASGTTRAMKSGTNYLSYELYTTTGRSTVWNATNAVSVTGTGVSQSVAVWGSIPSAQNVPAGSYSDTVVATASF